MAKFPPIYQNQSNFFLLSTFHRITGSKFNYLVLFDVFELSNVKKVGEKLRGGRGQKAGGVGSKGAEEKTIRS